MVFKLREWVEDRFKQAEEFYGESFPRCRIAFDIKGCAGGTANYSKKLLRFNLKLAIDNPERYREEVVPHEVAHIICRHKHGYNVKSHGGEWKSIMVNCFRTPPRVRHNMDTSKVERKTKEYRYSCGCLGREYFFGKVKHDRIAKNSNYVCAKCLETLKFEGKGKAGAQPKGFQPTEIDV